jgi:hypothetical protein
MTSSGIEHRPWCIAAAVEQLKLESLTNDEKEQPKRFLAHLHQLEQTRLWWNTSGLDIDLSS